MCFIMAYSNIERDVKSMQIAHFFTTTREGASDPGGYPNVVGSAMLLRELRETRVPHLRAAAAWTSAAATHGTARNPKF